MSLLEFPALHISTQCVKCQKQHNHSIDAPISMFQQSKKNPAKHMKSHGESSANIFPITCVSAGRKRRKKHRKKTQLSFKTLFTLDDADLYCCRSCICKYFCRQMLISAISQPFYCSQNNKKVKKNGKCKCRT